MPIVNFILPLIALMCVGAKLMVTNNELLILAAVSVLGAIISATLGWLESSEPFDARKYLSSIIRGILSGLVVFIGYQYVNLDTITPFDYVLALLMGAGVDVIGHRTAKKLGS